MDLREFFKENNKAAIAFSGGVDSSYLLYAAALAGADVTAYYARSQFQPEFEYEDARGIAEQLGVRMRVIRLDVLADEKVASNPADRCYYCKINIMTAVLEAARSDGYPIVCDGTNASDDVDDRPGFRALKELGIRSPLRECGMTKSEIRSSAREAGLPVWDKPAYACLATRIPTGQQITADALARTEAAEGRLFAMGYSDFRVRLRGDAALVQIPAGQYERARAEWNDIAAAIGQYYSEVTLDTQPR